VLVVRAFTSTTPVGLEMSLGEIVDFSDIARALNDDDEEDIVE